MQQRLFKKERRTHITLYVDVYVFYDSSDSVKGTLCG